MIRSEYTALFCILVPLPLILSAPVDDILKQQQQQIASGAYREEPYWAYYNQDSDELPSGAFIVKTRALDSLGKGNLLRNLNNMGSEWGLDNGSSWRFVGGSPKRGGGLDSLGRGNILRRVNNDDEINNFIHSSSGSAEGRNAFLRSLYSLGKGRGLANKKMDSLAGDVFGLAKRFDSLSGATFGTSKRNFDEIDRNGFGAFVKRNFDEIDRNGFGFNKRNFDEIDRTSFGAFVKRAA